MMSTYFGIETGRRALDYYRLGLEVAGHNVDMANTAGYSRQVVVSAATDAFTTPGLSRPWQPGQLGTGVYVSEIVRVRNEFLDNQYRNALTTKGYWDRIADVIKQVEAIVDEPNGTGFTTKLDSVWSALEELHKRPEVDAVRVDLVQKSITFTDYLKTLQQELQTVRTNLNNEIKIKVQEANTYIDEIGALNHTIEQVRLAGGNPSDLLDRRDQLVDALCALTGAVAGTPGVDDADGDFKITLNGRTLVQGSLTRHIDLVANSGNGGMWDLQVHDNGYAISSDDSVADALIETSAAEGTYELFVERLADEMYWTAGYGNDRLQIEDAARALGIIGSFALEVGSHGVRLSSHAFTSDPPGKGNVLGAPAPGMEQEYQFRMAAGDFEATVTMKWDETTSQWTLSNNVDPTNTLTLGPTVGINDFVGYMNSVFPSTTDTGLAFTAGEDLFTVESLDRHLISFTDLKGNFLSGCGLENPNPTVLIDVNSEDSLLTIANKINSAYQNENYTTNPPGSMITSPDQWVHASVEQDVDGTYFLVVTSNVAGEAARINVLPGDVCGSGSSDMYVARMLGLVENYDAPAGNVIEDRTSYIQVDRSGQTINVITEETGDVFVDDAYFKFNGKEYLSASNAFKDARYIPPQGNALANKLAEFFTGIRLNLKETHSEAENRNDPVLITVRHHIKAGEIYGLLQARDDILLSQMDFFDEITYQLATQFNAVHYAGHGIGEWQETTGMAYFDPIASMYGSFGKLNVAQSIQDDPDRIAAAMGDGNGHSLGCGDGCNALKLAQLKQAKLLQNGTANFNATYETYIAKLGATGQRANMMLEQQDEILDQIDFYRQSESGVNLDEEMLNIQKFSQGFSTTSRYIVAVFDTIDKIISGMGRVGL